MDMDFIVGHGETKTSTNRHSHKPHHVLRRLLQVSAPHRVANRTHRNHRRRRHVRRRASRARAKEDFALLFRRLQPVLHQQPAHSGLVCVQWYLHLPESNSVTYVGTGYTVLGIDYFFGDRLETLMKQPDFVREAWRDKVAAQARECTPKWVEAVRQRYGEISISFYRCVYALNGN